MFLKLNFQALFIGRLDNSVQWTAQYPGDRAVYFAISYSLLQCLHLPRYPFLLNLPLHPFHLSILTTPLLHTPPPHVLFFTSNTIIILLGPKLT